MSPSTPAVAPHGFPAVLTELWALTLVGYLLRPETKGRELEDLADEALTEDHVVCAATKLVWQAAGRRRAGSKEAS